ncbi:putative ABC transport system ATP-binding protein [Enterococcus sp. PF1-24]|uniref:ABC transporter ATP-binding protein n=1 Tax=unclassified Enterococcus TaxID=2608891 RepID=UPI0024766064|nr:MULTISPECIES: ABC transporter ATP-binding protein [unclassified Enterococcus]MDH6365498.1 putative ABC transport system ATP-binding protein [Enterococcus sp. PFB1-1]MDH6402599.1 putative ABC transport system ATP-binding protein [Enterococcus sp. PF1-24]
MIVMKNINKFYKLDQEKVQVLKDISLEIQEHEFVAIMGPSGSGKSTLINTISFLDGDFEGDYKFNGEDAYRYNDDKLSRLRNQSVGFVFQAFQLIDNNTVFENVALPLLYGGMKQKQVKDLVMEALTKVGIPDKYNKYPKQLSGGQQQRVAIARAIVGNPKFIVADEPTGALDSRTSEEIMNLFKRLNEEEQVTILMVTHDSEAAEYCKRVITVKDGELLEEGVLHAV